MSKAPACAKTAPTQSGENLAGPCPSPLTFTGSQHQTGETGNGPVNSVNTGNSINTGPTVLKGAASVEALDMSPDRHRKKSIEYPHPSRAHSTSTTGHSPYPSRKRTSSRNRTKKSRKPKFKVVNVADRFKTAIKILLMLVTVVNCVLGTIAIMRTIENHLSVASVWNLREWPRMISGERYLIASTSETCNEMAKEFQTKQNVTMAVLASFMSVCLTLAEPHNSGMGGHSIALYVDAKNDVCKQTQGHYRLPWDLSRMEKALSEGEPNDFWGPYSVAVPGHISTVMGLLNIDDDFHNSTAAVDTYFSNYMKTMPKMTFPVSSSLGYAISGSGNDALFTFLKAFRNVRSEDSLKVFVTGDVFVAQDRVRKGYANIVKYFKDLLDRNESITIDSLVKAEYGYIKQIELLRGLANAGFQGTYSEELKLWLLLDEKKTRLIDGKKTVINGHTVCTANRPTSSSFLIDALKKNEKAYKKFDSMDKDARMNIYLNMFDTLNDTVNSFKNWDIIKGFGLDREDHSKTVDMRPTLRRISEILKGKKDQMAPHGTYGANMFVIIDAVNQKAVSYVASLGDSMGSLVSGTEQHHILNNLLSGFADVDKVGPVINSLQPIIAMKNDTISLAMAGCGGVLTRSLDLARTLAVAVLKLIYDVPIQRAVTIPLLYPYLGNAEHSVGFPWWELGQVMKAIEERIFGEDKEKKRKFIRNARTDVEIVSQRLDRAIVATSDGKSAEGFYYDHGSAQMLPVGF